jgi:ferredoxin
VLLPVVGARRPGGRGRAATERTRLLAVLDVLGPAARAAALPGDRPAAPGAPASAAAPAAAPPPAAPPAVPPAAPSAGAPPAAVLAAADCDGCRVCVRGCPADALAVVATGTVVQLRHDVRACTDCGRCVELCPTGALTRTGSRPWQDLLSGTVVTLATVPVATCARCRGTYATTARGPGGPAVAEAPGLCPVCRFRRAQPFGSSVPAPRRG